MNRYQEEGHHFDRKSLRVVTGKMADWSELARDCVAWARIQGRAAESNIEFTGRTYEPRDNLRFLFRHNRMIPESGSPEYCHGRPE